MIEPAHEVLLALADDEHLMGQQHAEWIGVAPFLEEDLAFCSIAQDELGHAAALYELLGDADQLAFRRSPEDYRSCHLVELPCPDWADALVRHWLYDEAEVLRWDALAGSSWAAVAAVVERVQRRRPTTDATPKRSSPASATATPAIVCSTRSTVSSRSPMRCGNRGR